MKKLTPYFLCFSYCLISWSLHSQCNGTVSLKTQAELAAFVTNCNDRSVFDGNLTVGGANSAVSDISSLSFLREVTGNFTVSSLPSSTLDGLNNLKTVGGTLTISHNHQLTDITALGSLETVGNILYFFNNDALQSLAGIERLKSAERLWILFNDILSDCHAIGICRGLNFGINGTNIRDNAVGCNTTAEINNACQNPISTAICNKAQVVNCGAIIEGNSSDLVNDLDEVCNVSFPTKELVFKIKLEENARLDLLIDYDDGNNFTPFISYLDSCNPPNCVTKVQGRRLAINNEAARDVYFVIDFPQAPVGNYSILFMCNYEPVGDACATAIPLTCGQTYSGNSAAAVNRWRWENVFCSNGGISQANTAINADITHKFTLLEASTVTINFSHDSGPANSNSATAFVYGQCDVRVCLENNLSFNNPMVLPRLLPGTYYVVLESNGVVNYTLDLTCELPRCNAFAGEHHGIATSNQNFMVKTTMYSAATIGNGINLRYQAGTSILLDTGFQVKAGSGFTAVISDCTESSSVKLPIALPKIREKKQRPEFQIFPNPANNQTTILFTLLQPQIAQINLYHLNGALLKSILPKTMYDQGLHELTLDVTTLPPGVYYLNWQTETNVETKKVFIQR